jgi:predicted  nucleic acid-binding Zn-ribbon protein
VVSAPEEIETDMGDTAVEIAVLRSNHDLAVDRFEREIEVLRHELDVAREEAKNRFESFQSVHVRNHEKEHESEQHAASLAMANMDRRLEGMNEFRQQINDTEARYSTKSDLAAHAASNETQLSGIKERVGACERTAIKDRGDSLDRVSAETRFRALERLVYMASGAITVIMIILQFVKKAS